VFKLALCAITQGFFLVYSYDMKHLRPCTTYFLTYLLT